MTFETVIEDLKNTELSPGELSQIRLWLSAEYSYVGEQLKQILVKKPATWMQLRGTVESDKQADRKWDGSPEGRLEMSYRFRLKSIEKLLSALNTRLRVMEVEARNMH